VGTRSWALTTRTATATRYNDDRLQLSVLLGDVPATSARADVSMLWKDPGVSAMQKHAYLIIAHNNFHSLERLVLLLDDERNDIYLHIDKKVKSFDFARFSRLPIRSRVIFTPRISVYWGGFSSVQVELLLLRAAVGQSYQYYHFLSGADLPIKTQDEIHKFFAQNSGKEFVQFLSKWVANRVARYHLFSNAYRRQGFVGKVCRFANQYLMAAQRSLGYDRLARHAQPVKYGADWFSITHALACFVLANTKKIDFFRHSAVPSEHFLQTLVFSSPFYDRVYSRTEDDRGAIMRLIDWQRGSNGSPYVFREADFESIMSSGMLFARKFDANVDRAVIDRVYDAVSARQRLLRPNSGTGGNKTGDSETQDTDVRLTKTHSGLNGIENTEDEKMVPSSLTSTSMSTHQ
jgi:hypothetical protein